MKALIAENSAASGELLRSLLVASGYDALLVTNGQAALDSFYQERPDIVFLDIFLDGVDAFSAARKIKCESTDEMTPIVFIVTDDDEKALAQCMDAGGDDFVVKPFAQTLLQAKIESLSRHRQLYQTLRTQRDEMRRRDEYVKQEQAVAKKVFDNIVYAGCLDAACIESYVSPISLFNGDIVFAAERPNGVMCILLGDLTGTGLSAALGGLPVSEVFYSMVRKGFSITEIASEINRKLEVQLPDDMSMRCCLAEVDAHNNVVRVWNGGIPSVYLFSDANKDIVHRFEERHDPLGAGSNDPIDDFVDVMEMAEGDRIFLATDGLIDLKNAQGERLGEGRLEDAIRYGFSSSDMMGHVLSAAALFRREEAQPDDVTILIVSASQHVQEALAAGRRMPESRAVHCNWTVELTLGQQVIHNADPGLLFSHSVTNLIGTNKRARHCASILRDVTNACLDAGVLGLDPGLRASSASIADYYHKRDARLAVMGAGELRAKVRSEAKGKKHAIHIEISCLTGDKIESVFNDERLSEALASAKLLCSEFAIDSEQQSVKLTYRWERGK